MNMWPSTHSAALETHDDSVEDEPQLSYQAYHVIPPNFLFTLFLFIYDNLWHCKVNTYVSG
jgi:hypothetical protein